MLLLQFLVTAVTGCKRPEAGIPQETLSEEEEEEEEEGGWKKKGKEVDDV